jgi:phosphate:Na+ symporter
MIPVLLGGIGIFLVGMMLLSDGLRSASGDGLRRALQRFAKTPFTALVSGAGFTALVQSSSATTLTTIGFVSAGLLTFPQAVGLIFGANLGTTSTGWLVSFLGFKVDVGAVALPLVGIGALGRFTAPGRWKHVGTALAGFGLIFVGIDVLQDGMGSLSERMRPEDLYGGSVFGRLMLVAIGVAMTVVMQSSSAAVATTMTAIFAGGITVEQGGYLVIGQNLGTSVTALLAAIGGSIPVRRTAVAHTAFNGVTGIVALFLAPFMMRGALLLSEGDPTVALAFFHTGFNLVGVLLLFPVIGKFAAMVERVIPEPRPSLTRNLDPSVAATREVAVEAARGSLLAVGALLAREFVRILGEGGRARGGPPSPRVGEIGPALAEIRSFMSQVPAPSSEGDGFEAHVSLFHAAEHMDRLEAIRGEFAEMTPLPDALRPLTDQVVDALSGAFEDRVTEERVQALEALSLEVARIRKAERSLVLEETARGRLTPDEARDRIVHVLRLDRLTYHLWRAAFHLGR